MAAINSHREKKMCQFKINLDPGKHTITYGKKKNTLPKAYVFTEGSGYVYKDRTSVIGNEVKASYPSEIIIQSSKLSKLDLEGFEHNNEVFLIDKTTSDILLFQLSKKYLSNLKIQYSHNRTYYNLDIKHKTIPEFLTINNPVKNIIKKVSDPRKTFENITFTMGTIYCIPYSKNVKLENLSPDHKKHEKYYHGIPLARFETLFMRVSLIDPKKPGFILLTKADVKRNRFSFLFGEKATWSIEKAIYIHKK